MERMRIILAGSLAQQTVAALSDEFSKRILVSTIDKGKTVQEISTEQAVPLSTCYRRAREMVDQGLLVVERTVITAEGKKYTIYRSSFSAVEMASDFKETSLTAELNDDVAEKFRSKWLCLAYPNGGR
jgi:hypothetical protein